MTILTIRSSRIEAWTGELESRVMAREDAFTEFEATSLFCPRCRRATPARRKLLLVLPTGNKYDYVCAECGAAVGGKTDNDATDFYRTVSGRRPA